MLKNILKDAESESALKAVERMDVEIHRAIKFLQVSTDLRQLQKRADVCFLFLFNKIKIKYSIDGFDTKS